MVTSDDPTERVLDSALALPEPDRARVATALLASLPEPPGPRDDDPAFVAELVRRAERVERGMSTAREWEDVEPSSRPLASLHDGHGRREGESAFPPREGS